MKNELQAIYPFCLELLPENFTLAQPDQLSCHLKENPQLCGEHQYLPDLAKIEFSIYVASKGGVDPPQIVTKTMVHPGLDLLEVSWLGLVDLIEGRPGTIVPGKDYVIVVPGKNNSGVQVRSASNYELLALKIVSENIESKSAAEEAQVSVGLIDNILFGAGEKGLLLFPPSKIVRPQGFSSKDAVNKDLCSSPSFTLQWHVTQACDLHCKHCYDRSDRVTMTVDQGLHVLDDLYNFCQAQNVYGQVTFTGGNPLLYPHFMTLYKEAVDRGFLTGVLGNPMERSYIEEMVAIQKPEFYQVSLEGLQEHNDYIRGAGHYVRVMEFLGLLKDLDVYSMVMLTLTAANKDQVLPLADILENKTDLFTFNRLAMVGEGTTLASVPVEEYQEFLGNYIRAAEGSRVSRLKDNLCNLHLFEQGKALGGGCAGVGCGAAFNFVSLLPDGEVHACRKLPSLLGNIYEDSLTDIYQSALSEKYRMGSSACSGCEIRAACGGCLAVSYGFGLDIFTDLDPYCFKRAPSQF